MECVYLLRGTANLCCWIFIGVLVVELLSGRRCNSLEHHILEVANFNTYLLNYKLYIL